MQILNLKKIEKPPFICSFDLGIYGLIIRDLKVMETSGKRWIAFPSRQYEEGGKKKYFSYIQVMEDKKEAFNTAVFNLLAPYLVTAATYPEYNGPEVPF